MEVPRGAVVAGCVGVALLVAAVAGGRPGEDGPPLDPRSDGPLGTSALVSVLQGLDAEVELSAGLPGAGDDVALVLVDRLDEEQAADVRAWVEAGGRLVVTDPRSALTPPVVDPGLGALAPEPVERDRCTIDALADVAAVDAGAALRYEAAEADRTCFDDGAGAFVVARSFGSGDAVAVGGAAAFTNELLGHDDNAVLAAALLAPEPGTRVRFVDPPLPAGGGDKSLSELVSPGVRRGLLQLGVAFALYALWRAVRLGRPVPEDQLVRIAGSELVSATGRLLSRTRSAGAAAEALRNRLRRSLRARLGVPPTAPDTTLADAVVARSGADAARVRAAVGDQLVTDDDGLVAVARDMSSVHQEVLR